MNLGFVSMAALAIAALPGGCGELFGADVQVDDLCKTLDDQDFPAAPPGTGEDSHFVADFAIPVDQMMQYMEAAGTSSLKLKSVSLQPTQGIDDLACVDQVTLRAADGAQGATLTQYQRAADAGPVPVLTLQVNDVDVRSYATEGVVTLSADVAGRLPAVPWKAKVTACFTAAASLRAAEF